VNTWSCLSIENKKKLGCPPSSHVIVGREKQNVEPKVEGILTSIYLQAFMPFSSMLSSPSPLSCSHHLLAVSFFMDFTSIQNRTYIKI
jgi:hypothetical protein